MRFATLNNGYFIWTRLNDAAFAYPDVLSDNVLASDFNCFQRLDLSARIFLRKIVSSSGDFLQRFKFSGAGVGQSAFCANNQPCQAILRTMPAFSQPVHYFEVTVFGFWPALCCGGTCGNRSLPKVVPGNRCQETFSWAEGDKAIPVSSQQRQGISCSGSPPGIFLWGR